VILRRQIDQLAREQRKTASRDIEFDAIGVDGRSA
jgi:hypothetical protein